MKKFKLYYREHHCWLELDEETYLEIRRERQRVHFKRQKGKECFCPKKQLWLCDGLCDTCEFYQPCAESLDAPRCNEGSFTLLEFLSDGCNYEDLIADTNDKKAIIMQIRKYMPILLEYAVLKIEGFSDREIVKRLQVSRTSLYRKIEKMREILGDKLEN